MPDHKTNDEIDLFELLLKAVNILRANFWLIVSFFFLGSAIGLGYFFSSEKVFVNKMIISSAILTTTYSRILFENANTHLAEGSASVLASQFNISEKTVKEINSLKIENLTTEGEELKESDRFLISAEVSDQQILPELQQGLISYLENNDFVKIRVEQNRSFLKQMLASVEKEIKDMEEFKLKISSGDFFQSAKGNVMFDPTSVNSKILELTEKRIGYQNSLQLSSSVQVIEGFTKFEKQTKPKLAISMVTGSFIGLFFVGALLAFKSIRKLLSMAEAAK